MSPEDIAISAKTRIGYLEKLGDELASRGFHVRVTVPNGRPPSLHVVNPDAAALDEDILAESGSEGWWFWWSWAERIASVDDVTGAADRVARVLRAH